MLLFSSIVEYCASVYTCVFLNRIESFEKPKNNNNKYQNTKMADSHNKKQTDHA